MTISKFLASFIRDDDAAVTVDWVVLTAGIVALGLAVIIVIRAQLDSAGITLASNIDDAVISGLAGS